MINEKKKREGTSDDSLLLPAKEYTYEGNHVRRLRKRELSRQMVELRERLSNEKKEAVFEITMPRMEDIVKYCPILVEKDVSPLDCLDHLCRLARKEERRMKKFVIDATRELTMHNFNDKSYLDKLLYGSRGLMAMFKGVFMSDDEELQYGIMHILTNVSYDYVNKGFAIAILSDDVLIDGIFKAVECTN